MSWEVKPLGELSKIMYGYTESSSIEEVGPRFLRITDIQENGVEWSSVPYCKIAADDLKKYRLNSGDIVFARTGATTGKSFLVADPPESVFASYLIRVQINKPSVLPEYLNLYFQTPQYWEKISAGTTGSAQGGFNATKLGELDVPIPPLPEQQRIVGKLDAAFAALAEAQAHVERNRANARELFESYLNGVFEGKGDGWVENRLGDVTAFFSDGDWIESKDQSPSGIRLVQTGNIGVGEYRDKVDKARFITESTFKRLRCTNVLPGDCLVSRLPEPVGRACVVPELGARMITGVDCSIIRFNKDKVLAEFFVYFSQTRLYLSEVNDLVTGTTRSRISRTNLGNVIVHYPSIKRQLALLAELDHLKQQVAALETTYQQKQTELAGLKKAVLGAAFRGEL